MPLQYAFPIESFFHFSTSSGERAFFRLFLFCPCSFFLFEFYSWDFVLKWEFWLIVCGLSFVCDALDGWFARKFNQGMKLSRFWWMICYVGADFYLGLDWFTIMLVRFRSFVIINKAWSRMRDEIYINIKWNWIYVIHFNILNCSNNLLLTYLPPSFLVPRVWVCNVPIPPLSLFLFLLLTHTSTLTRS